MNTSVTWRILRGGPFMNTFMNTSEGPDMENIEGPL